MDVINKFNQLINSLNGSLNNQKIIIACSTGVDSMVLLDVLLKSIDSSNIIVAHVNHQKREQSMTEEKFIIDYTKKHKLKNYIIRLEHYDGSNFQEWARNKRYDFFKAISKKEKANILLVAHHADDNLETIIMRMIRSSSLEGYAGIKEESKFGSLLIKRPLLSFCKEEIYEYAKINKLEYFEDSSNASDDYTRNRIRHHIIPILKKENNNLVKAIENYSSTLFDAAEYFEKIEKDFINSIKYVNNNDDLNNFYAEFEVKDFVNKEPFLKQQILFRILKPFKLSKELIQQIISLINSNKNKIICNITSTILFIKEYGRIIITVNKENQEFYLKIDKDGAYNLPNNAKIVCDKNRCNFITSNKEICYNSFSYPIIIRTRKNGDKLKVKIGTVSVSNYLTNHKVPYLERQNLLLLCDGNNLPITILGFKIK